MSKNVPNVRFEGFVDKWRKASIDEIMSIRKETGNQNDYSLDVELENLVSDIGVLIGDLSIRTQSNSIFRKGDILFGRLRPYLNKWWLSNTEGVKSGEIWAFYPQGKNSNVFLYNLIQTYKFLSVANTSSGTKMPRSDWSNLSNVVVDLPRFEEQQKIGAFFKQLDDTIVLQRQLVEQQQQYKKAMLQKMFPQKGERVPKVRFAGFSGDWEQRKLDKVLKERKVKQKISKEVPLLAFAAGQGVIDRSERKTNNRDFLTKDATKKTYLLTKYDDIVYNPSNLKYGAIDRNKHGQGVISPIYVTFETDEIPSLIELIVKSETFKQRALQYEEGTVTKRQSVKPENLLCLNVVLPNSKDEQMEIGNFFKKLDDTIALHEKKLKDYLQLKKALLQRMFV